MGAMMDERVRKICKVEGCSRKPTLFGMCYNHYHGIDPGRDYEPWKPRTRRNPDRNRSKNHGYANTTRSRLSPVSHLYFVKSGEHVKIGVTRRTARKRIEDMQTGNPVKLELLAFIRGFGHMEGRIHKDLDHLRENGEWFLYTYEIERLIDVLKLAKKEVSNA